MNTIKQLRKEKGLTQVELAEILNIDQTTISKWELNQSTPDLEYLVQLSDFFAVSTDYLIKGEQIDNTPPRNTSNLEEQNIHSKEMPNSVTRYKLFVYFGSIISGVSLIGMIVFVICSALNPWGAMVGRWYFEGLLGFLIGTNTLWFFAVLLVLFAAGVLASVYGIKKMKQHL